MANLIWPNTTWANQHENIIDTITNVTNIMIDYLRISYLATINICHRKIGSGKMGTGMSPIFLAGKNGDPGVPNFPGAGGRKIGGEVAGGGGGWVGGGGGTISAVAGVVGPKGHRRGLNGALKGLQLGLQRASWEHKRSQIKTKQKSSKNLNQTKILKNDTKTKKSQKEIGWKLKEN